MSETAPRRTVVAITGASGGAFAVEFLRRCPGETFVILSRWGAESLRLETGFTPDDLAPLVTRIFPDDDLAAALSSGSNAWDAYVIVPCSVTTLSKIACGFGDTLVTRVAQVALKERRRFVVAVRETPLSSIHLQHMLTLSQAGATIMPVCPPFYRGMTDLGDVTAGYAAKLLGAIGVHGEGGWRAGELAPPADFE